jgi:hypothetical protein
MKLRSLVCVLLLLGATAFADYVEVRKATKVLKDPNSTSQEAFAATQGMNLHLIADESTHGYYHVQDPTTGATGWIYRSYVRRNRGNVPIGEEAAVDLSGPFPASKCTVPYNEEPQQGLGIESCGLAGQVQNGSGEASQNPVKNNLCQTGIAQPITIPELFGLQQLVDDSGMPYGNPHSHGPGPPPDRSKLYNLPALNNGSHFEEKQIVTFVGYLVEAHYSPQYPSGSGETVNCKRTQHEEVDIHLAFSTTPGRIEKSDKNRVAKLCKTVSGEMIPHLRPSVWDMNALDQVMDLKRPVRVTGQLFFDASHRPCNGNEGGTGDPRRISSWEIHPIYTFEVCKLDSLNKCNPTKNSLWQPISRTDGMVWEDEE